MATGISGSMVSLLVRIAFHISCMLDRLMAMFTILVKTGGA